VTRDRWIELTVAVALALLAAALSPWGFTLLTGRPVLSLRVTAVSAAIAIFLLVVAFALAARGRARTIGFHLMLWTFPVALLASLEIGAIALHLADRILPLEDNSSLRNQNRYPGYLFSDARWKDVGDGLRVYRPFTSDGIAINARDRKRRLAVWIVAPLVIDRSRDEASAPGKGILEHPGLGDVL